MVYYTESYRTWPTKSLNPDKSVVIVVSNANKVVPE